VASEAGEVIGSDQGGERDRRPLFALLAANTVSGLGSALTLVAIPWFVLITTGSAAKTGITVATGTVPYLLAGVFGGALVDRIGYRRSSIVSDLWSTLAILAIPLIYDTIGLAFWELLVLVFLATLVRLPGQTGRDSLFPQLAEMAKMPLERANSLSQGVPRLTLLVGPAIAGILIAAISARNVLWIDSFTFAVSAIIVAVTIPPDKPSATRASESYLRDTLEGFRFIHRDRVLLWIVITFAIGSLVSEPIYTIVLPVYAKQVYGTAADLGLLYSSLAVGSLIGLGLYAIFGPRLSGWKTFIAGFFVRALTFVVLVFLPSLPIAMAAIVVNATMFEPINPLLTSILQRHAPEGIRGRVFGSFDAIAAGTLPAGTLIGGILLGSGGLVMTLSIVAGASLLQAVTLPLIPSLRDMDTPAEVLTPAGVLER